MATTNFGQLTDEELTMWKRDVWRAARYNAFTNKFIGDSNNAMIQRIPELTKTKKGARAVITLVNDLVGDGRVGDNQLEENEEPITSQDTVINIDQLRNANRLEGMMADQRSVVTFRENSRNVLAYWLSDRIDQLTFLSLSGVNYSFNTNGSSRVGSELPQLDYAGDVTPPSANRYTRWDAVDGLQTAADSPSNSDLEDADTPTWGMLVDLKAYAKENFIRPIRTNDGIDFYHVFMTPTGMAKLKQDADYLANVRNAGVRGGSNDLFKGTDTVMVDGLAISEYRHVYNTRGLATGSKWGDGTVDGNRVLFCGAQALAFADIGPAEWVEKVFDYNNQPGIATGKIFGMLKPQFESFVTQTNEDFGLLVCDTAI